MAEAEDAKVRSPEEENSRTRDEWVAFFTGPVIGNIVSDEVQNPCFFFFFKSQNMVQAGIWSEHPEINNIGAKACPNGLVVEVGVEVCFCLGLGYQF